MLNSRADVLIKISKVVDSQHGLCIPSWVEGLKQPSDVLKRATRWRCCCFPGLTREETRQVVAAVMAVKSALQVRSDCLTKTLLDWP